MPKNRKSNLSLPNGLDEMLERRKSEAEWVHWLVWPTQRQGLSKDQRSSETLQRGKVKGDEEDEDGGSQSK